jgi:hypothetical protein
MRMTVAFWLSILVGIVAFLDLLFPICAGQDKDHDAHNGKEYFNDKGCKSSTQFEPTEKVPMHVDQLHDQGRDTKEKK